jgi:hypothetical protein
MKPIRRSNFLLFWFRLLLCCRLLSSRKDDQSGLALSHAGEGRYRPNTGGACPPPQQPINKLKNKTADFPFWRFLLAGILKSPELNSLPLPHIA